MDCVTSLDYKILRTEAEIDDLVSQLLDLDSFSWDLETTSLDSHSSFLRMVAIGFTWKEGQGVCVPFHNSIWNDPNPDPSFPELVGHSVENKILSKFKIVFETESIGKTGQNTKYDCRVLSRYGIIVKGIDFDTMVAHYDLYGGRLPHGLDEMSLHHLNHIKIRTKSLIPKKTKKNPRPHMGQSSPEAVAVYNLEDTDFTYRMKKYLIKELDNNPIAKKLYYEIDLPLLIELISMECNGVHLDLDQAEDLRAYLAGRLDTLSKEINSLAGREVTLTAPQDLQALLFDELKLHTKNKIKLKITKSGQASTAHDTLEKMDNEPIIQKILQWKEFNKLQSTYVKDLNSLVSPITNLVHCSFNQCTTETGRLSSSDPNLQNVPQRTEEGRKIRGIFISRWEDIGGSIGSADYSQIEARILAHVSGDINLIDCFNNNKDIHTRVASLIYDIPEDKVTKAERDPAKTINYGLLYGMQANKLALTLGISKFEALNLLDKYNVSLTGVRDWMEYTRHFLRYHGYTENLFGRRRYIPKVFSKNIWERYAAEREGINFPIQSLNSEAIKIAMSRIGPEIRKMKSKLILQVHDELVVDTYPGEEQEVKYLLETHMKDAIKLCVPVVVEAHFGKSWGSAHI